MTDLDEVRRIVGELPETSERSAWGTPAFYVRDKIFARQNEDRALLAVRVDLGERAMLLKAEPDRFTITDHYRNGPWMLVVLAAIPPDELREVLQDAWRERAPRRLVEASESRGGQ